MFYLSYPVGVEASLVPAFFSTPHQCATGFILVLVPSKPICGPYCPAHIIPHTPTSQPLLLNISLIPTPSGSGLETTLTYTSIFTHPLPSTSPPPFLHAHSSLHLPPHMHTPPSISHMNTPPPPHTHTPPPTSTTHCWFTTPEDY